MTDSNNTVNLNVSWLPLLGIAFIVLKLTGFIAWSWIWVLAPFWIPIAFALIVLAVVSILWLFAAWRDKI